jgi:hypothetical protein
VFDPCFICGSFPSPFHRIIDSEPSPESAATVAEKYLRRLDELGDDNLRRIAALRLPC